MTNQNESVWGFELNQTCLEDHSNSVKDYCLTNGLVFLKQDEHQKDTQSHDLAYPLPVTLMPTKFPAKEFQYALDIQNDFNKLIFNISNNHEFLKSTLKSISQFYKLFAKMKNLLR